MQITSTNRGAVTILDARGRLTLGDGDVALHEAVLAALAAGRKRLLLDLGHTRRLDSAGLAELVNALNTVRVRGGSLKLANLSRRVRTPLELTRLVTVFEIFDSIEQALASFDA